MQYVPRHYYRPRPAPAPIAKAPRPSPRVIARGPLAPIVEELRRLIARSGMSYAKVGEESGVSDAALSNIFSGFTAGPRLTTLNKIARIFGKRVGLVDDTAVLH